MTTVVTRNISTPSFVRTRTDSITETLTIKYLLTREKKYLSIGHDGEVKFNSFQGRDHENLYSTSNRFHEIESGTMDCIPIEN